MWGHDCTQVRIYITLYLLGKHYHDIPCSQDDNNRVEKDRNEGDIGEDDIGDDDFLSFNEQGMEELDDSLQNVAIETTTLPNDFEVSTFVQSLKYENINTHNFPVSGELSPGQFVHKRYQWTRPIYMQTLGYG